MSYFKRMKGSSISPPRMPLNQIAWSWLGAFLGIYSVSILSQLIHIELLSKLFLVGSFGASAALIYGAPHAEFSQPRNLVGGHIVSALVGVTLYKYLPLDTTLLAALAVSISIVLMHLTRTMHPPGGATALITVISGAEIHHMGYLFVLTPIGIGILLMLVIALFINNLSNNPKRHYPKYWF